MIKINYKEPEETETMDEVARHNIQICDEYKKADYLELSCIVCKKKGRIVPKWPTKKNVNHVSFVKVIWVYD